MRALVTLPRPDRGSVAVFRPMPGSDVPLTVTDEWRRKACAAARLTAERLTGAPLGGVLRVYGDLPPGRGLGSSTSDVTAAVRAVADSLDAVLADDVVAEIAVAAEGAADSVMFGGPPVLFAHRAGSVLERLPSLPPLLVVGCDTGRAEAGVDTLAHPLPDYTPEEAAHFPVLLDALRAALRAGDAAGVAEVADASARINERFLPKPGIDAIRAAGERTGSLGLQVAHSGTVVGLLFDDLDPVAPNRAARCAELLRDDGFGDVSVFSTVRGEMRE